MHILILGNNLSTLVNFNGTLIETMRTAGHQVTAAAAGRNAKLEAWLASHNVAYHNVAFERAGLNPLTDLKSLLAFISLMRNLKPDLLFAYMIKPVVYGLIAAKIAGVSRRTAMITGLGYAFTESPGESLILRLKRSTISFLARTAYGIALRFADTVLFQNPDDEQHFARMRLTRHKQHVGLVDGSGVDLSHYTPALMPADPITFLMIARLLRDKGVLEFVEAARLLKQSRPELRFVLVGPFDPNPAAIKPHQVEAWVSDGIIEYLGAVDDVRPKIAASHVFVLPSYREGTPRTVLEAMAMKRPVITTDVPGCREPVKHGINGFLVPPYQASALADAMIKMADDPALRSNMASASLDRATSIYDAKIVSATVLRELGIPQSDASRPTTSLAA